MTLSLTSCGLWTLSGDFVPHELWSMDSLVTLSLTSCGLWTLSGNFVSHKLWSVDTVW